MSDMTLREAMKVVLDSMASYEAQGTKPWTWEIAVQDLSYQVGSLTKVMLQLQRFRYADGRTSDELEAQFQDELADVLANVLYIAGKREIDLDAAIAAMVAEDKRKVTERTAQ